MATAVDIKQLLEAGAHFGHKTSRWHPKMAPYIHSKRGQAHIIDLNATVSALDEALPFLSRITSEGKQVLLVGTKRQARPIILKAAEDTGMPVVSERWLGGMLTNHKTMFNRVKHLKDLEERMESGELASHYSKLEVQRFQEEIDALNIIFGGVKNLSGLPGALYVTDVVADHIAVKEANRLDIPVVGIVDTNADPTEVTHPIPANDDAIKALELITSYVVSALNEGKTKLKSAAPKKAAAKEATKEETKDGS